MLSPKDFSGFSGYDWDGMVLRGMFIFPEHVREFCVGQAEVTLEMSQRRAGSRGQVLQTLM